jgi:hypothetical protein
VPFPRKHSYIGKIKTAAYLICHGSSSREHRPQNDKSSSKDIKKPAGGIVLEYSSGQVSSAKTLITGSSNFSRCKFKNLACMITLKKNKAKEGAIGVAIKTEET